MSHGKLSFQKPSRVVSGGMDEQPVAVSLQCAQALQRLFSMGTVAGRRPGVLKETLTKREIR